ncbi:hypothetical protein IFM89_028465 [Coptis chinensis]|uniref:Pentatricopeptide repeat-containing protein n=1 Tax=Coptis chinensis TaxID=261450 RepID=A0A835M9Y7_9MAGN|nr:hypothetical protein IFM89_028465 [Coptis chinensis]
MVKLQELVQSGLRPDQVTIVSSLSICTSDITVREIHGYILRNGLECISEICNILISMYGKFGRIEEARRIFKKTIRPDNVAWNALISSYAQNGYFDESIQLLRDMKHGGLNADVVTYCGIVSSLAQNNMPNDAVRLFNRDVGFGIETRRCDL